MPNICLWDVEHALDDFWRAFGLVPRMKLNARPHIRYSPNIAEREIEAAALEAEKRREVARAEERKLSDLY